MWTDFHDMHSGGGLKEAPYGHIYIEAPEDEAVVIFYNRFGHNPNRVSCTCCGEDYWPSSHEDLAQLTGYDRGCRSLETPRDPETGLYHNDDPVIVAHLYQEEGEEPPEGYALSTGFLSESKYSYQRLEEYRQRADVLFIHAGDIPDSQRVGEVPEQGFVWRD